MPLAFYGLKSCDSCRAALKDLAAKGVSVDVRDVREDGVPENVLREVLAAHGADRLINRRSTTWRGLDDADRQMDPVVLIGQHPALMKRPLIIGPDGRSSVGWDAAARAVHGL